MLDAFTWQAAPFGALVSELSPQRDLGRNPIFQVVINLKNFPSGKHPSKGWNWKTSIVRMPPAHLTSPWNR